MSRLALLERAGDVPAALKVPGRLSFVSLSPEASLELGRRGVPYRLLEELTPVAEFNREAIERCRRLDGWTEALDARLHAMAPRLHELGLRPAGTHYHALKVLVDCLASKAQLLSNALKELKPREILYRPSLPARFGPELRFEGESVFSALIPEAAAKAGAGALELGPPASFGGEAPRPWRRLAAGWLRRLERLRPRLAASGKRPLALYLYSAHDLPLLLEALSASGFETLRVPYDGTALRELAAEDPRAAREAEEVRMRTVPLWRELGADPAWRGCFRFHGLDTFPVAAERLARFVREAPTECLLASLAWERRIEKRRPACVLSASSIVGPIGHGILAAARRARVPVVLYQEGAGFGVPYCPIYDYTDMRSHDLFLSYGVGAAAHLEEAGVRPSGRVAAVGSARLDRLKARLKGPPAPREHGYVYAPTHLHGNVQHLPYNGGTAAYYFEAQKRLVSALADFPEARFTVKLPPGTGDGLLAEWLKLEGARLGHCGVVDDRPFEEFLASASGFIFDFPSTTFLEALLTDKPIFVLLDPMLTRLERQAEESLKRRVALCRSAGEFAGAFRQHLYRGAAGDAADLEPRRRYATHLDDGLSLERAVREVSAIASG